MNTTLSLISGERPSGQPPVMQRILLYRNELYRVPATYHKVRVVAGTAFITQSAHDFILGPGHEASLQHSGDVALLSPLRNEPLVVELFY